MMGKVVALEVEGTHVPGAGVRSGNTTLCDLIGSSSMHSTHRSSTASFIGIRKHPVIVLS